MVAPVAFPVAVAMTLLLLLQPPVWATPQKSSAPFAVQSCVTAGVGQSCELAPLHVTYMSCPLAVSCPQAVGQQGSVSWVDLVLPKDRVLLVKVTTTAAGQNADGGFFVRPTRLTRKWGMATVHSSTSASFYLAAAGQFSVEFTPDSTWRDEGLTSTFEALMLFVNSPLTIPATATIIPQPASTDGGFIDLGPNAEYVFANTGVGNVDYDWGRDMVFKVALLLHVTAPCVPLTLALLPVRPSQPSGTGHPASYPTVTQVHDDTRVYFQPGARVRARIVQTEKKIDNVLIAG